MLPTRRGTPTQSQQTQLNYLSNFGHFEPVMSAESPRLANKRVADLSGRELEEVPLTQLSTTTRTLLLDNNRFFNVPNLAEFHCLEKLSLAGNCLSSTAGLSQLQKLKVLDLQDNNIYEISGLQELRSLEWLNLSHNKIQAIENMPKTPSLQFLDFSNNRVIALGDLSTYVHLKILNLSNNQLESVEEIPNFLPPSLTVLDLSGNQLKDLTEMMLLHSLPVLEQFSYKDNPSFTYDDVSFNIKVRYYILCWCKHLRTLNGITITHGERHDSKELDIDGHIRTMQPGQHDKLIRYLMADTTLVPAALESLGPGQPTKEQIPSKPHAKDVGKESCPAWSSVTEETATSKSSHIIDKPKEPTKQGDARRGYEVNDLEVKDVTDSTDLNSSMLLSDSTYIPVLTEGTQTENIDGSKSDSVLEDLKTLSWRDLLEQDRSQKGASILKPGFSTVSKETSRSSEQKTSHVHFTPPTIHLVSPRGESRNKHGYEKGVSIITKPILVRPRKSPGRINPHVLDATAGISENYKQNQPDESSEPIVHMSTEEAMKLINLAATLIQANVRGFLQRKKFKQHLAHNKAAIQIQSAWKGYRTRNLQVNTIKAYFQLQQGKLQRRVETLETTLKSVTHCVEQQHKLIGELYNRLDGKVLISQTEFNQILQDRVENRNKLQNLTRLMVADQPKMEDLRCVMQDCVPQVYLEDNSKAIALGNQAQNSIVQGDLVNTLLDGAYNCGIQKLNVLNEFAECLSLQISRDAIAKHTSMQTQEEDLKLYATSEANRIVNDAVCEASILGPLSKSQKIGVSQSWEHNLVKSESAGEPGFSSNDLSVDRQQSPTLTDNDCESPKLYPSRDRGPVCKPQSTSLTMENTVPEYRSLPMFTDSSVELMTSFSFESA